MKRLICVSVAVAALCGAAVAQAGFSGNACGLVNTSQLATVHVAPQKCVRKHSSSAGGTTDAGMWGFQGSTPSAFELIVVHVSNPAMLPLVEKRTRGAQKVSIGDWAEATSENGGTGMLVEFVKHGYWVQLHATTPTNKPLSSTKSAVKLAQQVAAKF